MNETEEICRFCLKTIEKPFPIDEKVKEIIEILMLKLDLRISPEPVMCYGCAETLKTALDFKSACMYTEDCLYPFIEGKNATRLDLREIYLKVNDSKDVVSVEGREVCRFCMTPSNSDRCTPVDVIEENVEIKKLFENYLPKVVMGAIEKPVACENCYNFLRQYSLFVTSFSHVEQQIQSHAIKTLGRDCVGEIDLRQVRDFSLDNLIKREVETIDNDNVAKDGLEIFSEIESKEKIIFEKKIKCEEMEVGESKINLASLEIEKQEEFDSFAGSDEIFMLNHIPVNGEAHADIEMKHPFLEPLETEVIGKYLEEDVNHIGETIGESGKSQRNENNTLIVIDPSVIFSGDVEIKPIVVDTSYNAEEANHTVIESGPDQVKLVKGVEETVYHCKLCPYKTKVKKYLARHMLVHKDISEVTSYQCLLCPYKTKRKESLTAHMLIHKDHSEVTTYDCNFCSYKATRKHGLKIHMLTHQDNSKVEPVEDLEERMYRCKLCPYKAKLKKYLTRHMLVHKDTSEVTSYQCLLCPYKTKRNTDLTKHMLVHKDSSEVTTYDCNFCSYKTKRRQSLKKHMLTHQDKPKDAKSAQNQQGSMWEHQEFEGCLTIKSEEVDIKDEEDECDDESNKL